MNFNWYGNETNSAGTAEFGLRGWSIVKVQLDGFTDAVHLSNLMDQFKQSGIKEGQMRLLDSLHFDLRADARDAMNLPQGYEPHELPADYTGPLFVEGQMNAAFAAGKREAAEHILEMWNDPWGVSPLPFIDRLRSYVEELK